MTQDEFKEIQQYLGYTSEGLARELGVSFNAVSAWRQGRTKINGPVTLLMRVFKWLKENRIDNPYLDINKPSKH